MNGVSSIWVITHGELIMRLGIAALLGGLIGIEREWNNHAAGFRTHILVCVGSALIMLLSIYGFSAFVQEENVRIDPARLAAQVISGIGFLGAGAILRNGSVISGLTTAASVWVVAAIGLCVGAGFLSAALFCTLMVLISLLLLNKWEKLLIGRRRHQEFRIKVLDHPGVLGKIASAFSENSIQIANVIVESGTETSGGYVEQPTVQLYLRLKTHSSEKFNLAVGQIRTFPFVLWMDFSRDVSTPDFHGQFPSHTMRSKN